MSHTADDARHLPAPNPPEPTSAPPAQPAAPAPAGASLSLDGELPRLGSTTMTAPAPQPVEHAQAPPAASPATAGLELPDQPTLPTAAPVLTPPTGIPAPDVGHASPGTGDPEATVPAAGAHPMAHAMPAKSPQSEASRKAAEIRAAKKAKARKVKVGVALGAIVVAAVVGPPLFRWFSDAINEAGSTSTEQPAD